LTHAFDSINLTQPLEYHLFSHNRQAITNGFETGNQIKEGITGC
jgi:hypothetical protein